MEKINEILISIDYGIDKDSNLEITQKMRDFLNKEQNNLINLLKQVGWIKEKDEIFLNEDGLKIKLLEKISAEEGIEIAGILSEEYQVISVKIRIAESSSNGNKIKPSIVITIEAKNI